ncbi:SUMO1 sentrin specific peptidase 1 [Entomophthora muscae]|uniref:SUMO1 sentrin specific peptidase 1 n=2 Tax=Entomophthora muscae TaxID=34485 RepID=A0ACC2U4W6_9FUNG|nr:SUMO1 sentrin specific peptidase 1 [Entomophthora muscae]
MLTSQQSASQFSISSFLLLCLQFSLYLIFFLLSEPEEAFLLLAMSLYESRRRFLPLNQTIPYFSTTMPRAIQRKILNRPGRRLLYNAKKPSKNAIQNTLPPATGREMGIQDILLQAGSTLVDPIFTPDDMNRIIEEGLPVSKHLLRKLERNGVPYRPIPLTYGRQITLPDIRKTSAWSYESQSFKQHRAYPSKFHITNHKPVHPYCPREFRSEGPGPGFYQELRKKKHELVSKTDKQPAANEREVLVESKSVASQPLFDLPAALPANCEEKIKGGICNQVPLATNLTPNDLATLQKSQWLNGDAINASLSLLTERSNRPVPGHKDVKYPNVFAFPTYFFEMLRGQGYAKVARQAKKKQIFSKDVVLVPIHMGNHWTLISIDFRHKLVTYFDSLLGSPKVPFDIIKTFLEEASKDILKQPFDIASWRFECPNQIPTQKNGYDCGMFCIMFAKSLASPFYPPDVSSVFPFKQSQMQMLRHMVSYEVITGQLLHN